MKYFIWEYNPNIINIHQCSKITFIIPTNKVNLYTEKSIKSLLKVNSIDFKNIYLALKKEKDRGMNIEDIFTLQEEIMDWVGVLKSIFVSSKTGVSDILFKDKYYMRSVVNGIVPEPDFFELKEETYSNIPIREGMIKPRKADSVKGIQYFNSPLQLSSLKNKNGYFSNKDFLVEDYIHYDKMVTVDGYTDFNKHERFFSHEYNNKLSEFKKNGYFTLHTNSFYYTHPELLEKLFSLTKTVLQALSIDKEITPFHFEWFYSKKNNTFTFTEAGKRFGGAKIPNLIKKSFGVDILKEYWQLQEGKLTPFDCHAVSLPKCCATSYVQLINGKKMNKSLKNKIKNEFYYNQNIPIGVKTAQPASINDVFFMTQYSSENIDESYQIANKINKDFIEICK